MTIILATVMPKPFNRYYGHYFLQLNQNKSIYISDKCTSTLMLENKKCYHYYRKHMGWWFQKNCTIESYIGLKLQDQHLIGLGSEPKIWC